MVKGTKDKRAHERFHHRARIRYRVSPQSDAFHEAEMQNCSEGGMYFESADGLNFGETIHITCTDKFEGCSAKVQWCRRHPPQGRQKGKKFGVGVAYCDPENGDS